MPRILKKEIIDGQVFSIHLEGVGFSLAQMRNNYKMEFFNILRKEDYWEDVDMNKLEVSFDIIVASQRLVKLFHRNVTGEVVKNLRAPLLIGLSLSSNMRDSGLYFLNLVKYKLPYYPEEEEIIIGDLDPIKHKDILYSYDYIGMVGQVNKIKERLLIFFVNGINIDPAVITLYPEVGLPPKGYKRKNIDCL